MVIIMGGVDEGRFTQVPMGTCAQAAEPTAARHMANAKRFTSPYLESCPLSCAIVPFDWGTAKAKPRLHSRSVDRNVFIGDIARQDGATAARRAVRADAHCAQPRAWSQSSCHRDW